MKLRSLVSKKVRPVAPEDDLTAAFHALVASGRRQVPVLEGAELVGILSEWDVLRAWARRRDLTLTVRRVMTANVHSANADEELAAVAQRFVDERIGCVPVLDKGKLIGLVDVTEIVAAIAKHELPSAPRATRPAAKKKTAANKRPAAKRRA